MATYQKRGRRWRAIIRLRNHYETETFSTKGEAQVWATAVEAAILAGERGDVPPNKTFGDLLLRYAKEVSSTKRGERWERVRIERLVLGRPDEDPPVLPDPLASVPLQSLSATDIAAWRDRRSREVSAGAVRRDWTLLSHACTVAVREWRWLRSHPMENVRRPAPPRPRDRIFTDNEIERILFALGYSRSNQPATMTARVGAAFAFALETAMRAGEIVGMRWSDVDRGARYVSITGEVSGAGKTAAARRDVPLSSAALAIIDQLAGPEPADPDKSVFGISSTQTLDALFRKAKARALVEGATFHDSRHTAITRLAGRLDVLALARMVGHRDLRMLQVYFNESASDLAKRLG